MNKTLKSIVLGMSLCGLTVTAYAWQPPAEDCVIARYCEGYTLELVQDCRDEGDCYGGLTLRQLREIKNTCRSVLFDVCRPVPSEGTFDDADPDELEACMKVCGAP